MAKIRSASSWEWQIAFFRAGDEVPGRAWLLMVDKGVRRQYLIWLAALRTWKPGPYALPASVPWWRAMKDEMKGIYEMRDQHGKTNYRLFCLLDAKAPSYGVSAPVVVILAGASKPEETKMNEKEYRKGGRVVCANEQVERQATHIFYAMLYSCHQLGPG